MLKAEVPLMPNFACAKAYGMANVSDLHDGQLCAGGEEGIDSCRGDSGGPLMAKSGNTIRKKINIITMVSLKSSVVGTLTKLHTSYKMGLNFRLIIRNLRKLG